MVPAASGQTPSAEALREHRKGVLPKYMVPSSFVTLERLPLIPNGKLDWRALLPPKLSAYVRRDCEATFGKVEEILRDVKGAAPVSYDPQTMRSP